MVEDMTQISHQPTTLSEWFFGAAKLFQWLFRLSTVSRQELYGSMTK